jgi:para-nitrobenzyl esterase
LRFALRWVPVAWLALLACGDAEQRVPVADPTSERSLATGRVVGFTNGDGAHVWRGIPTAKPPAGPLRWRAPLPPEPWEGVRDATRFGSPCPQFAGSFGGSDSEADAVGSEDCLVANVFAPRFAPRDLPSGEARLPVMVWIHGGGNSLGSAELYDLGRLAVSQRVIAVAVHYRLGVFGWFHHPALHSGDASPDDRSGNYGTLDLIRSLEWVRDNAAAFGGDPERVTVFGESAGGENVYSLLLSPRARGRFQRAISQSGVLWTNSIAAAENLTDGAVPGHRYSSGEVLLALLERRGAAGREAAKQQLAALSGAEIEALLRGAAPAEILSVLDATGMGGMYQGPFLVRDGHVLSAAEPLAALEAGQYNRVPAIVGTNRDENKLFLLFTDDAVTRLFGFPLWLSDGRRYELMADYQSRMWKVTGVDEPAQAMSRWGDVFAYRFDWDEQPRVLFADFGRLLGAAHAMEVFFLLGRLDIGWGNHFLFDGERRPAAQRLTDAMMSYWGEFARGGAPGRGDAGDLPAWEPWDGEQAEGAKFLVLDTEEGGGIRMSPGALTREALFAEVERDARFVSQRERCEVYASYVRWSTALSADEYREVAGGACREFALADFDAEGG